jgi:hypothetical protein
MNYLQHCEKLVAQSLIGFQYFTPCAHWNWMGPLSGLTTCFCGAIKDDGNCVPCGRVVTVSYEKLATLITPQFHIAWQLLVDSFINKLSRLQICRHNEVHKKTVLHSLDWAHHNTMVHLAHVLIDDDRQVKLRGCIQAVASRHGFHLRPLPPQKVHTPVPSTVVPAKPNQPDDADYF